MNRCTICGSKAKRSCKIKNSADICSQCCANIRSQDKCLECSHFKAVKSFEHEKIKSGGKKELMLPIIPELEDSLYSALELINQQRFSLVENMFRDAEAIDPEYYLLNFAKGTLNAIKGELDSAITCFKKTIDKHPYFIEAHFNLAVAYQKKLDIVNMIRSFRNVTKFGSEDCESVRNARSILRDLEASIQKTDGINLDVYLVAYDLFNEGIEYMNKQQWENAIITFDKCAHQNPQSPKPYGNIGLCLVKLGKKKEAMDAYNKALELDPDYEPVIINRAALRNNIEIPDGPIPMVEYAKDYQIKKKSLISDVLNNLRGDTQKAQR